MKKFIVVFVIVLIILGVGIFLKNKPKEEIEVAKITENIVDEPAKEKFTPKNGIVISDTITEEKNIELKRETRIKILENNSDFYLIEVDGEKDTILKDDIYYFDFNKEEKYSLAIDVSEFNIVGKKDKSSSGKIFKDNIEFAKFIIDNKINYAYIRVGGRGWGTKGTLYYDENARIYMDICEYLKIPYGFYFIEEALNEEEVLQEVEFINKFINEEKLEMNVLPIALDLEYQDGKGRTDNFWENRVQLVNMLISEFKKYGIESILYANGARIETYLKESNCKFWTAMYIRDNKIPTDDYKTVIKEEEEKIKENPELLNESFLNTELNKKGTQTVSYSDEYLNKVTGWQFAEDGASQDGIETHVDLSIFNNEYFSKFYK